MGNNPNAKNKAMLMMAICAVLWSIGGIFIKLISWHPLLISGGRSLLAAIVVGGYMMVKKIPLKVCKYSVGAGVSLALCLLLFVVANKMTTAANAIVLQYTAPIFILIVSALFFKQKLRKKEILAVLGTMAGVVLFFFDQLSPGNLVGNVLAILAGAFIALAGAAATFGNIYVNKIMGAAIFPAGLAMVLIAGSELFTGNCLLVIPLLEKEITLGQMVRNLGGGVSGQSDRRRTGFRLRRVWRYV